MIINLNLQGKKIIVIGGGKEALKRIKPLLKQDCKITVISSQISNDIKNLVKRKKIELKKKKVLDTNFLKLEKPYIVITTTNNKKLNQKIISQAKKKKIIAYSADNPDDSDFSNPAIIDLQDTIQIAIFTGGRSPVMSKKIKEQIENAIKKTITDEEIEQIGIQEIARTLAKEKIPSQTQRKAFLNRILSDKAIKQLIKDKNSKNVEKHIVSMLRDWQ